MGEIRVNEFEFQSADNKSSLNGYVWLPEKKARAVVQLIHGMAEHIERYDEFAQYLASKGFCVVGHNQLGHGKLCPPEKRGVLPSYSGKRILIADVGAVRKRTQERVGISLPYFMFGHSLGSFILRCYLASEGKGLSGAIICGTGSVPSALSKVGNSLARSLSRLRGDDWHSKLLESMGVGAYARAIKDAQGPLDWLSYKRENIESYESDELSGFSFSSGGYATVTALTLEACSASTAAQVPSSLPLFFVAGEGDPVGNMGKGVREAAKLAEDSGALDVKVKIYPHMRHEILNEDGKSEVMEDISNWIERYLPHAEATQ